MYENHNKKRAFEKYDFINPDLALNHMIALHYHFSLQIDNHYISALHITLKIQISMQQQNQFLIIPLGNQI